jgi:hypothetical protein
MCRALGKKVKFMGWPHTFPQQLALPRMMDNGLDEKNSDTKTYT